MRLTLSGGGLAAGREGKFAIVLEAESGATGGAVDSIAVRGTVVAAMDTPRPCTRLGLKADALATGAKFPRGVKLMAELGAVRAMVGRTTP